MFFANVFQLLILTVCASSTKRKLDSFFKDGKNNLDFKMKSSKKPPIVEGTSADVFEVDSDFAFLKDPPVIRKLVFDKPYEVGEYYEPIPFDSDDKHVYLFNSKENKFLFWCINSPVSSLEDGKTTLDDSSSNILPHHDSGISDISSLHITFRVSMQHLGGLLSGSYSINSFTFRHLPRCDDQATIELKMAMEPKWVSQISANLDKPRSIDRNWIVCDPSKGLLFTTENLHFTTTVHLERFRFNADGKLEQSTIKSDISAQSDVLKNHGYWGCYNYPLFGVYNLENIDIYLIVKRNDVEDIEYLACIPLKCNPIASYMSTPRPSIIHDNVQHYQFSIAIEAASETVLIQVVPKLTGNHRLVYKIQRQKIPFQGTVYGMHFREQDDLLFIITRDMQQLFDKRYKKEEYPVVHVYEKVPCVIITVRRYLNDAGTFFNTKMTLDGKKLILSQPNNVKIIKLQD